MVTKNTHWASNILAGTTKSTKMNLLTRQLDLNFFFLPCDSVKFISDHPEILLLVDIMVMMLEIKDIEESFYLPDLGEFWVFRVCPVRCADGLCDDCEKKKSSPVSFLHKLQNTDMFIQQTFPRKSPC